MATTTKAAAPAKKSSGFKGVKDAWIILVICCIIAYCFYFFVLGDPATSRVVTVKDIPQT